MLDKRLYICIYKTGEIQDKLTLIHFNFNYVFYEYIFKTK